MKRNKIRIIARLKYSLVLYLVVVTTHSNGQEFKNTVLLEPGKQSPTASLDDISWIQGRWTCEAFGGVAEEHWMPPSGNSMLSMFRLTVNGKTKFFELQSITNENNTLMYRLKHFNADLTGWEEKNEPVEFPLVKVTKGKVFFSGLTFEHVDENRMNVYVRLGFEQKPKEEVLFVYKRMTR